MKPAAFSKFSRPTTAKKAEKAEKPEKQPVRTSTTQDENIVDMMESLIISQKECERSGKYVEAEAFKRKVKALQEEIDKRDISQIRQRHEDERRQIEQAHLEELNCFNIEWGERVTELEKNVQAMEEELLARHQEQIRAIEQEMNAEKPGRFKESAQLLNLKKIEQELARQENYMQAHQVQVKAQKLEKEELEKWRKEQSSKCKTNLNILKIKQENQINALKQRIDLSYDQKRRQKELEEESIILKYQNVLKELEYQQKQEIMKFEKLAKLKTMQKKTKLGLTSSKVSLS